MAPEPTGPVWTRLPDEPAPERPRVTRAAIVAAAITLADEEGLSAVSIRRVAAALDTRPMGLYSHIGRKDDLVDLMIDHVAGDFLLETVPEDWREALSEIAHRTRAACLRHPWLVAAMDHRPEFGPNAVRHFEQSLAAVSSLDIAPAEALTILRTVDKFTLGQVIDQLSHHAMRQREALTDVEWARAATERLDQLIASGEFPNLARVGSEVAIEAAAHEESFEAGLDWLLAGIAASLDER
ncbi:MAG TPA: TetR/AcrR family transcriptional regulator [Solirubrobacter sp.]